MEKIDTDCKTFQDAQSVYNVSITRNERYTVSDFFGQSGKREDTLILAPQFTTLFFFARICFIFHMYMNMFYITYICKYVFMTYVNAVAGYSIIAPVLLFNISVSFVTRILHLTVRVSLQLFSSHGSPNIR